MSRFFVTIHKTMAEAAPLWNAFEQAGCASGYQRRAFMQPWITHIAPLMRVNPLIASVQDSQGQTVALLPLGIMRRGPVRMGVWLGGRQSNLNLPLQRAGTGLSAQDAQEILKTIAQKSSERIDLFLLANQPVKWMGVANPFVTGDARPSPSNAYGAMLGKNADNWLTEKDSKATRKKLRAKASKLQELGAVRHWRAQSPEDARAIMDALIAQKTERFAQKNIGVDLSLAPVREFLRALAEDSTLDLHALLCGDKIVATYGGIAHGDHWHGLVNSFDNAPDIARSSPGDLLLRDLIRDLIARKFTHFDLGIGEARYKAALCDETIALADSIVPVSALGHAWARIEALRIEAKRIVKANPRALALAQRLKRQPL